jgi:hypothetical protein
MTQSSGDYPASRPAAAGSQQSTSGVARSEAAGVAESAKDAGGHVARTASDQAKEVAAETGRQARNLMRESRNQLREQARTGQHRAADRLNSIADELREMASSGTTQSGVTADVVREASDRLHDVAAWLSKREPGDLLNEIRGWARQHPGTFLFGAAIAGVVAGRLTGGAVASMRQQDQGQRRLASDQYGTRHDETPAYGTPEYRTSQYGMSQPGTSQYGTSGYEQPAQSGNWPAGQTPYRTPQPGQPPGPGPMQGGPQGTQHYQDPYRQQQDPYRQQGGQVTP